MKKTEEQFIKDSKEKFGDRFDYSKCKYTGTKNNITLICKICKTEFIVNSHNHLNSVDGGCKICAIKKVSESKRLTQEEVIKRCKERENEKEYDYSKIKYIDAYTKIEIVCKKHGSFWMLPYNFYGNYQDCPRCFESKAEKEIENFLISKNIAYKHQMSFPDLKDERKLFYDFYLEKQNLLIECQGEQHYRPVEYFGGEEKFKLQKYHDKLKKEYSLKHNYNFLEIPYWGKRCCRIFN